MAGQDFDVVVVGAGPNGLTAAAVLALAGLSVAVLERNETVGGGCRTEALTLPGFRHDRCSAIHPMALASPIFSRLNLAGAGVEWCHAASALAHPFDDGSAAVLSQDIARVTESLGADSAAWADLVGPFLHAHQTFLSEVLRPIRIPAHPWLMAQFGWVGLQSSERLQRRFLGRNAQALLAGNAAHSFLPLHAPGSAAFGLVLAVVAQSLGWPCARGGSQAIADALALIATREGAVIETNTDVGSMSDIPQCRAVLFDTSPRQLARIAGADLSARYRRQLERHQNAPGAFKIDYALSAPIPWAASSCRDAATVHVGGSADEIAHSEATVAAGRIAAAPFVLVAQQSVADESRAPAGHHTGWAYCHVPAGCDVDMTDRVERQLERFAPGFRDTVISRHITTPLGLERHNPNMAGGDIAGGANTLRQTLLRPVARWNPYTTSNPRLFLCSSATPPGGGVHGMCGYWAAKTALDRVFHQSLPAALDI